MAASSSSIRDRVRTVLQANDKPVAGHGTTETGAWVALAVGPYVPTHMRGELYSSSTIIKWLQGTNTSAPVEGTMARWAAAGFPPLAVASASSAQKEEEGAVDEGIVVDPPSLAESTPAHLPAKKEDAEFLLPMEIVTEMPLHGLLGRKKPKTCVFHTFFNRDDMVTLATQFARDLLIGKPSEVTAPSSTPPEGLMHPREGYIYVLEERDKDDPTGYIKVGRVNMASGGAPTGTTRFNPRPLVVVASFRVQTAATAEAEAHHALGPWHVTGEWFKVPYDGPYTMQSMYSQQSIIMLVAGVVAQHNHTAHR